MTLRTLLLLQFSNIRNQLGSFTSRQHGRTKPSMDNRTFSVAAHNIWNELPTTLQSWEMRASFRKTSKLVCFNCSCILDLRRPLTLIMEHVKILCRNNDIDIVRVHLSPFDVDTARLLGRSSRHLRRACCD